MAKFTKRRGRPKKMPPDADLTPNQAAYQMLLRKYSQGLIAEFAGTTTQLLTRWDSIPPKYADAISKRANIPVEELLPDPCEGCQNPFCPKNQPST